MQATRQFKYHAFLSHNTAQKDWTRRLAGFLREQGLRVFFDEDSIKLGEDILVAIENGLRSSRHVLLVLSPEALASQWVALELSTSLYRDRNAASRAIIPVLRRECEIPLTLARLKYLDATSDDFDRQAAQLLNAIDKESVPTHAGDQTRFVTEIIEPRARGHEIEHPGGTLSGDAGIYVERRSDQAVLNALNSGHGLITVWGARQTGKSSLGVRVLEHARRRGRKTAWIDFSMFSGSSLPQLLFSLATEISDQAQLKQPSAESFLASRRGPLFAFESHLANITAPVLIAFDEVDYLKPIGEMDAFFRFIRAFHGKQVMSGSHPVSVFVSSFLSPREFIADSFSSPFNIGFQVRLANFERDEAFRLFELAAVETPRDSLAGLIDLTGGQPYLTHLIAWLLQRGIAVDEILRDALSPDGHFGMHLQIVQSYVEHSSTAQTALKRFVKNRPIGERDLVELCDRGILKMDNGKPVFASELYKKYFTAN